jgi:SNF2 family DNA or RNA helicase
MTFTGTLLPYQVDAVDKMASRGSMLVAYDMGLGKTVLTIAAIERLLATGEVDKPGIVICLSSLKYQWASQIKKFSDAVPLVIDGTPKQRAAQYAQAATGQYDYVILNYEQVVNDWENVKKLDRGFVIIDEATAIKSFKSKRSKAVKRLVSSPVRFALTGTPIENGKPEELYSIMQFVDQKVLGRFDLFDQAFIVRNTWGGVDRYRNLPTLHTKLKEAAVRKAQKDPDVAPYLPDTIHNDPLFIPMDRKSAALYRYIAEDVVRDLDDASTLFGSTFNINAHYGMGNTQFSAADELRGKIMAKIGCLRMLCSDPVLLRTSAAKFRELGGEGSMYAAQLEDEGLLEGVKNTPKLDVLVEYVKDFLDQNPANKVVIFASYVDMGPRIADLLGPAMCKVYSGRLDARTKEDNKEAFNNDPDIRVLISSDAGGYGVDLPAANLLVNYDLPWSSGAAVQRNGRIRRASSEWPSIIIQNILMSGSIEVRQWESLQQKTSIADAIIDGEGIDEQGGMDLTLGTLRTFLIGESV